MTRESCDIIVTMQRRHRGDRKEIYINLPEMTDYDYDKIDKIGYSAVRSEATIVDRFCKYYMVDLSEITASNGRDERLALMRWELVWFLKMYSPAKRSEINRITGYKSSSIIHAANSISDMLRNKKDNAKWYTNFKNLEKAITGLDINTEVRTIKGW